MNGQDAPQTRGKHIAAITMGWLLPLAEIAVEVVDEVNSSAPTAWITVKALVRVTALVYASNRKV